MRPDDALLALVEDLIGTLAAWRSVGEQVLPPGEVALPAAPPPLAEAAAAPAPRLPPAPRPAPELRPAERPAPTMRPPAAPVRHEAPPEPAPEAPPPAAGLFGGRWAARLAEPADPHAELDREQSGCTRCPRANRRRRVLLEGGPARPRLVVVVGPPSAEEEAAGRYFVGEPGGMLERMLVRVLALEREDVRVVSVAPCAGGPLERAEAEACRLWLDRRLDAAGNPVLLGMGREVALGLGHAATPPGRWVELGGRRVLLTHHPREILADPTLRRPTFEHLQDLARRL